ncbi:MAG: Crp/Fnr family transcriptional regulator [Caldilineaceae bacterium]|nr:Crp/Fnr family transcriptional regulator [Caldilineaceae bacterium]
MNYPDPEHLYEQLRRVPYFADFEVATLRQLAMLVTWHEYAPGAIVFLEGDLNNGLYSVYTGWVKVVKFSMDGREQVLRYFGPGDVFNEISIFQSQPNPATAIALEQTVLWQLHRSVLQPLLTAQPDLLLQVMANMAERITYLAGMVADLSLHTVEVRLARLLLEAATEDLLVRQSWLTQAELAARLGTVSDVLSRALRTLAEDNLIQVDRRQILILNRPALMQRAQLL